MLLSLSSYYFIKHGKKKFCDMENRIKINSNIISKCRGHIAAGHVTLYIYQTMTL